MSEKKRKQLIMLLSELQIGLEDGSFYSDDGKPYRPFAEMLSARLVHSLMRVVQETLTR